MNNEEVVLIKSKVVDYMQLVATRNRAELDKISASFIQSLENNSNKEVQLLLLFVKGITCFFNNQYVEAKAHFEQAIQLSDVYTDLKGISLMGLGFTNRSIGDLDEAVSNLFEASETIHKTGDFKSFNVYCYQSLGEIHAGIQEYTLAISYYEKAYTLTGRVEQSIAAFRYHMGLGGCYLKMKEYTTCEYHLQKAKAIDNIPAPMMARIINDLGILYLEINSYEQAEKCLLSCIELREQNNMEDAACTSMIGLAELYKIQNRNNESITLLNRCLVIVDKFKTKSKKIEVLKLLAQVHSYINNHEAAVKYYEQYIDLFTELKGERERNIFKFKNEQIEAQKKIITDKHNELAQTFEEIKRLKVNKKAAFFSWTTIIFLVIVTEVFLDPLIESYSYDNLISLMVKVLIAMLFKPIDGLYEKMLWERTIKKVND
jgi:tetratricopeptide (TPR) repeat protein